MTARKQNKTSTKRRGTSGRAQIAIPHPFPSTSTGPELKLAYSGANDQQLYHNTPASLVNVGNYLDQISVGTLPYQRLGAQITLRRVTLRALFNSKDVRPNVTYRVVLVAAPTNSSTDTFAEWFATNSVITPLCAPVYPGICKVYCDKVIAPSQFSVTPLTSGGTPKERTVLFSHSISMHESVRYSSDSLATTRLVGIVIAYDAYGTLTIDNIASIANAAVGMYFTDA
jgi:hypothetical protein